MIFFFLDFSFFLTFNTFSKFPISFLLIILKLPPLKPSYSLAEVHHPHPLSLLHSFSLWCLSSSFLCQKFPTLQPLLIPSSSLDIPSSPCAQAVVSCCQFLGQCLTLHSLPHSVCQDVPITPDLSIV